MFNFKSRMKYLFLKSTLVSKFEDMAFAKLPIPVILTSKNGQILFANNCFHSIFKRLKHEKNITSFFSEITLNYLHDNKNSQSKFFLDGKWFRISKIYNRNKILLYFYDITKDKLIEEKRNTFIASLTHDLKTPINAQIRALDLLLNGTFGDLQEEQTEIIREITKSCKYMYNLIFNIVDTYLFEKGERKLVREKFDWTQLVNETMHELSYLLEENHQTMQIKSHLETCEIYADKFQMKRAVTNLISNAITHSTPHSNIEITMRENEENIYFDVKNESAMALPEKAENIFNKFQTNLSSGSGLGLYIVKQIISSEGGSVHAENLKEKSCVFGFKTPKKLDLQEPISNYLKK